MVSTQIDFSPMERKQATPKVGVAIFLERDGKVLMLLRKGSHKAGTRSLPGGHMDLGEDFYTTCKREILEEVGVEVDQVEKFDYVSTIMEDEGLHYVTLYFVAKLNHIQEPKIMEPEKIAELKWFNPENPPKNIFSPNRTKMFQKYVIERSKRFYKADS